MAGVAGLLLVLAIDWLLVYAWIFLDRFGLAPGTDLFYALQNAVFALGISAPQYLVLRLILCIRSPAAKAWVPATILIFLVADFVAASWFRNQPQPATTILAITCVAIFAVVQGLILREIFGTRWAIWLWLLSTVLFAAFVVAVPSDPIDRALGGREAVAAILVDGAILGFVYGALYGASVVVMIKLAARQRPAAPNLEAEAWALR